MTGHVPARMLAEYATGDIDVPHAFSVEAHLVECGECRDGLRAHVGRPRLDRVWLELEDVLDRPAEGPVERVLGRLGVPGHLARLLVVTPSLRLAWLTAVVVSLGFAVAAAHEGPRGVLLFLVVAALLPPLGVAAAFAPALDPAHEVALAAPFSTLRLLLVRAVAVLVVTLLIVGAAALALPEVGWTSAAWLLPSLALTASALALSTYLPPLVAVGVVLGSWVAGGILAAVSAEDRLAAFHGGAQIGFACLAAAAAALALRRRDRLDVAGDR
jgi:hypothetical protein